MLGKTLGGATVATGQGLVVFLLTLIIGFRPANWLMLPLALIAMFLTALLFTSLGMAIASRMSDMHAFPLIMNFLVMPLFFLSGVEGRYQVGQYACETAKVSDDIRSNVGSTARAGADSDGRPHFQGSTLVAKVVRPATQAARAYR